MHIKIGTNIQIMALFVYFKEKKWQSETERIILEIICKFKVLNSEQFYHSEKIITYFFLNFIPLWKFRCGWGGGM